eukprot:TRINITY_DN635_c0_g1_i4.p1 TRINITY_DN635_c0_g1~~TRINITY_DN635_c0_g1_i4.p1  ORF type:complete len:911 (-),score=230.86 TRINITY_DN635_c0_g1_i4:145-2877(-)
MWEHSLALGDSAPSPTSTKQTSVGGESVNLRRKDSDATSNNKPASASSNGASSGSRTEDSLKRIKKLRWLAYFLLFASLCVLGILTGIELSQFKKNLVQSLLVDANNDLHEILNRYEESLEIMEHEVPLLAAHTSVINALVNASYHQADVNETSNLLETCMDQSVLTFVAVLDANKMIVQSSSGALVGSIWDPHGFVSEVLESPDEGILVCSTSIDSQTYFSLNPGDVRQGEWSFKARQTLNDTGDAYAMARFVVAPITVSGSAAGVVLGVQILTGDLLILQQTLTELADGFAGIYFKANGTIYSAGRVMYTSAIRQNFNWKIPDYDMSQIANSVLGSPRDEFGSHLHTVTVSGTTFYTASSRVIALERNGEEVEDRQSDVFIVRGYPADKFDSTYSNLVSSSLALVAGFVIFDVIAIVVAVRSFVDPLEKLVRELIRRRQGFFDQIIAKIMSRKKFFMSIGLFMAIALTFKAVDIGLYVNSVSTIQLALSNAERQANGLNYAYMSKSYQMVEASLIIAGSLSIRRVTEGLGSSTDFTETSATLSRQVDNWKIEYCTLVNRSRMIVAGGNKNNRMGEVFDPSGAVTKAMQLKNRIYASVEISYSEFEKEGAKQFFDSFSEEDLNYSSIFHPYNSKQVVIVRLGVTPVYSSSDDEQDMEPVGALIMGDIVNGKAFAVSMVQDEFQDEGYTAIYYYNEQGNLLLPLQTIYNSYGNSNSPLYDVRVETVEQMVRAADSTQGPVSGLVKVNGEKLKVYVSRADDSWRISRDGNLQPLSEFYPPVYFVRGTSVSQYDSFKKSQLALALSSFLIVFFTMAASMFFLYRPIFRFSAHIETKFHPSTEEGKSSKQKFSLAGVLDKFGQEAKKKGSERESTNQVQENAAALAMETRPPATVADLEVGAIPRISTPSIHH